jgi:hypothetical protein
MAHETDAAPSFILPAPHPLRSELHLVYYQVDPHYHWQSVWHRIGALVNEWCEAIRDNSLLCQR